ncbi:MAG: AAA-associated domain-containing protein, partial [Myxococcaceae bacterium]
IIENKLPYPRDPRSKEFLKLVDRIHDVITESTIPEEEEVSEVTAPRVRRPGLEVLPNVQVGEINGLLEVLDDRGGKEDAFKLAADLGREYAGILNVVKAAELLELVDTPRHDVVLTKAGKAYLTLDAAEKKQAFRQALQELNVFKFVVNALAKRQNRCDADVIREELAVQLPFEDTERLFETIVGWGRNADLFDFETDTDVLVRDAEEPKAPPPSSGEAPPPA